MTPGKLEWRKLESFFRYNRLRTGNKTEISKERTVDKTTLSRTLMRSGLPSHRWYLDNMLRGFMKMDVREKERRDVDKNSAELEDTSSSSFSDGGSALVQCVERFFKNPQQNYEVPLQLLQEWFSDTSTHRRQELAKLFLALLQEQGLDMDQIMGQVLDYSDNCKSNEVFLEVSGSESKKELIQMESDLEIVGQSVEMRDVSCGDEDSSSMKNMQWVDTNNSASSSLISDPIVLKTLREYRPMPVKAKPETYFGTLSCKGKLTKSVAVDLSPEKVDGDDMMAVVGEEGGNNSRTEQFDEVCNSIAQCEEYPSSADSTIASEYPLSRKEKTTRSVGTSPFEDRSLSTKCCSEPNIRRVCSNLSDQKPFATDLRRSQSLPSLRCSEDSTPMPPLAPIELQLKKRFASKETSTAPPLRTSDSRPLEHKPTVINSVVSPPSTTYKARTTFVEMSHAEFMKRQMLLNEKVSVRQGFRLGGQILYVPELVSCSAPHAEKSGPPLLLHSNVDVKRSRNPVEIKLAMMGNNEMLENVVVSQTSSSHTIHYTPTHNHIATAPAHSTHPTQLINDKCSVVYVRESLPHAQPVLVATTPTTTWQEEARKKPIIAYAKRKPSDSREKQGVIFGDQMKVLIASNGILNSVHEVQPTKLITPSNTTEREVSCGVGGIVNDGNLPGITTANSGNITTVTSAGSDIVFVKRPLEERKPPIVAATAEPVPTKPTLPKFNQTFVQNFQLKPVRTAEPMPETQTIDYIRKIPKKLVTFSPVSQVGAETTVVTEENGSHEPAVVTEDPVSVTHTHIQPTSGVIHSALSATSTSVVVERPVQVKTVSNAPPTQVGLLIYTQGSPEESSPVQTLLLTTLPNGSAYCVRLPPNANLSAPAVSPQMDAPPRPVVVQTVPHVTSSSVKSSGKKPDSIPVAPPAESNKVALLKDLKEFENVFEETKLKFEKEKQLNVGEAGETLVPTVSIEPPVQQSSTPSQPQSQPQPPSTVVTAIPKFDCEKVVVGVKRKPEGEMPVVTRLYTTAKKPLIVVANYGQTAPAQMQTRPVVTQVCSTSPPAVTHIPSKSPKGKSRSGKTYPNPAKSPPTAKPQQKPQEDEKTQQKIFAILEEYAVQKEHSPDTNNRPAPRRRSNPPSASASKKKRPLMKSKEASGDSEDGSFSEM